MNSDTLYELAKAIRHFATAVAQLASDLDTAAYHNLPKE